MEKTLILYESTDEQAKAAAEIFRLILGPAKAMERNKKDSSQYQKFETIIFFYPKDESGCRKLFDFVKEEKAWLSEKKIMNFYSSENYDGMKEKEEKKGFFLEEFSTDLKRLKLPVLFEKTIHMKEALDTQKLAEVMISPEIVALALRAKDIRDAALKKADSKTVKEKIDTFIKTHNTCTLATGDHNDIRSTPIEFIYVDNSFYFLTEGGEKFVHILQNPNVSVSIYNEYSGMNDLNGLQIKGHATIVPIGSALYCDILKEKRLSMEAIERLACDMNMIRVSIKRMEFLSSSFKTEGFDAKQILEF